MQKATGWNAGSALSVRLLSAGEAEPVIALFEQIAAEEGWQDAGELRAHVARSEYFALWEAGRIAGGLQLIRADTAGWLPCLRIWPELSRDLCGREGETVHVAVLAMAREWRGRRGGAPFWLLTAAMWRHCVETGVRELRLEATPPVLRAYRLLGWPLAVRGELREHWGEPCFPCSLSVREVGGALAERAVRSRSYRRILANMVGVDRDAVDATGRTHEDEGD